MLDALPRALRAAFRALSRAPLVLVTAVGIVGLGVGATTAAFSVMRGVLAHSVPYPDRDALVQVISTLTAQGVTRGLVAFPRFETYATESGSFAALAAYVTQDFTVADDAAPLSVPGVRVSPDFFRVTGVPPVAGRAFTADEQVRGGARALMISERLWKARFGGAPDVIGRSLTVNGDAVPVVGVVSAAVAPPLQDADIWLPRVYESDILPPEQVERGAGYLRVMGRLKPGVTLDDARRDLARVAVSYRERFGALRDAAFDVAVLPLGEYLFGDVRGTLVFTWGAGLLVFLLACANAGNVLLARYLTRRQELDVRSAVGATRADVVLQLLAEAAVIAVGAGIVGLAVAAVVLRALGPLASRVLATGTPYAFDWTVFAAAGGLAIVAVAITGAVPAVQATSGARGESIASGARASGGRAASRWRRGFVIAQVALSYLLLAGAFQQAVALARLERADRGFDASGLTTFRLVPSATKYATPESRLELYRLVEERVGTIPGVAAVGASQAMPVGDDQTIAFAREEDQARKRDEWPVAQFRIITPGYFAALGVRTVRGRTFTADDGRDAALVAVVNATLARRQFGDADPVGKRIFLGSFPGAREVVGVVADVRQRWLDTEASPEAYIPAPQLPVRMPPVYFAVRTTLAAGAVVPALRTAVAAIDPAQSLTRVRTMDDAAAEGLAIPRMRGALTIGFALLGVLLAAVGLWSVVAQFVADRTRDVAIRTALGATPRMAAAAVTGAVTTTTAIGIVLGLAAALGFGGVTQRLIVGLARPGVPMLIAAAVPLVIVALVTAHVMAGRAARVDPAVALRAE